MRSDDGRPERIYSPNTLAIPAGEVGRIAQCGPNPRWQAILEAGIAEARSLLSPKARFRPLPPAAIEGLFRGGGTPVEPIIRRGRAWAFVATIGPLLERRVVERFDAGRYLEGLILDAAGSTAAEALGDLLERECAGRAPSTRFSPGYCGWRLEGQRSLFSFLTPEEIGVRLLPSMLMHPLKSISGVVVQAPAERLRVPEETCSSCEARGCARRGAI